MHTKKILATLTLAGTVTAMAACADPTTSSNSENAPSATASRTASYDVSTIPTVDEIAALVPDDIKKRGTLRNGASTGYAPAEYMDTDGQTPIGYDVDINKALANSRRSFPLSARSSTWASHRSPLPPSASSKSTWSPT